MSREIEISVQSLLPGGHPQGLFKLRVSPDATVQALLHDLCTEACVTIRDRYCLRLHSGKCLQMDVSLVAAGVKEGDVLHWISEGEIRKPPSKCDVFVFLACLSFFIGATGICTICVLEFQESTKNIDFAVVFDAGSTHTSMLIYEWEGSKFRGTALASQAADRCDALGAGISSYEDSPYDAGKSLEECLAKARANIPSHQHSTTPVYLGATAGMRLLNEKNPSASNAVLNSVRDTFSKSGFEFINGNQTVRILTGSDEGSFSWITSNYITNAFDVNRPGVEGIPARTIVPSIGALDLGGASTQITFSPGNQTSMPDGYSRALQLFGKNYTIYTHSYLCFGVNEMNNRVLASLINKNKNSTSILHPCLPEGFNISISLDELFSSPCVSGKAALDSFGSSIWVKDYLDSDQNVTFVGEGKEDECSALVSSSLFNFTDCKYSSCSFNGVFQPSVSGPFFAFSSFFYVSSFLNLTTNASSYTHNDFTSAINSVCKMTWKELSSIPISDKSKPNLPWYCLQSVYIDHLLFKGYKFDDNVWRGINFEKKISNMEIGWTLGFVLNESNQYAQDIPAKAISTVTVVLLMILFLLFIAVSVALFKKGREKRQRSQSMYKPLETYGAI